MSYIILIPTARSSASACDSLHNCTDPIENMSLVAQDSRAYKTPAKVIFVSENID